MIIVHNINPFREEGLKLIIIGGHFRDPQLLLFTSAKHNIIILRGNLIFRLGVLMITPGSKLRADPAYIDHECSLGSR